MLVQTVYALGLLVGVALAHHRRCPLLMRSAYVLAANCIACNLAVIATGQYDPVAWFALIDTASAFALLWRPAGRTQAVLGAVYVMQLGLHFAQWPGGAAVASYLSVLTVGGACQIAFLIWGAIDGDGRKVGVGGRVRRRHGVAVAHGGARMESGGGR